MSRKRTRSFVSQDNDFDQLQVTKFVDALRKRRNTSNARSLPATSTPKPNQDCDDVLDLDCPESLIGSFTPRERSPSSPLTASEEEYEQHCAKQAKKKKRKKYDSKKKLQKIISETKHRSVTLVENTPESRIKTRQHIHSLLKLIRKATQEGHFKKSCATTLDGRLSEAERLLEFWETDDGQAISDVSSRLFQGPYLQSSHNIVHEFSQKTEGMIKRLKNVRNDAQKARSNDQ
jgi:hypothetical protein